jgi:hypothetical protein
VGTSSKILKEIFYLILFPTGKLWSQEYFVIQIGSVKTNFSSFEKSRRVSGCGEGGGENCLLINFCREKIVIASERSFLLEGTDT